MKLNVIIKTLLVNAIVILFFSGIYYSLKHEFINVTDASRPTTFIDFINLGTTIQSTIGISNIYPNGTTSNSIMMVQQFLTMPSLFLSGYLIHTL